MNFTALSRYLVSFCLLLLSLSLWSQKPIPPKPSQLVNDYANVMSGAERRALEQKLVAYNDSTSTQISIVLDEALNGEDAFDYSYRLAEAWGIGQREDDNGLLIYAAINDRQLRIQTGYGAEGFLPDALAKRIIDQVIAPAFRQQQYYQGLNEATDIIIQLAAGEYEADPHVTPTDEFNPILFIIMLLFIFYFFFGRGGGGGNNDDDGGYYRGGRYSRGRGGGWIFLPGGGFGGGGFGGGGGGFGGGGFGGFGGGGFGGGGAGGSW